MQWFRRLAILGAGVVALGGCSFSTDALWPSLSGEEPTAAAPPPAETIAIQPSAGERASQSQAGAPPRLGSTNFEVQPPQPLQETGTFVGQKVGQLRTDLVRLQGSIQTHNGGLQNLRQRTIQNAETYHQTVASIESRLQVGTTPGNPMLVDAWNLAQRQLEQVNSDISAMNDLANRVSADAALSTYLLESVRAAYGLSGAIEEDHRQLSVLEDDTNQTVVLIDRLLTELSDDIRRQSAYVSNERSDINTLAVAIKNGELFGSSLASRTFTPTTAGLAPASAPRPSSTAGRRPLVVIRFDRPSVAYEQALYSAVSRALERRPDAFFDVVAISPQSGNRGRAALDTNAVRRNAQQVLRSLTNMGLPANRVALSAGSSPDAQTNEVRVFVR
ncbi:MAG: hypothetical protein HQ481_04445 [Alphaproteobacteria bacterium]|nr:hypothetical protein [Alphaproteobacteria bacterium]